MKNIAASNFDCIAYLLPSLPHLANQLRAIFIRHSIFILVFISSSKPDIAHALSDEARTWFRADRLQDSSLRSWN